MDAFGKQTLRRQNLESVSSMVTRVLIYALRAVLDLKVVGTVETKYNT